MCSLNSKTSLEALNSKLPILFIVNIEWWFAPDLTSYKGLPQWLNIEESAYITGDTGDAGLIPGLGRSLEKEMATHSNILARQIPVTEEPIRL